MAAISPQTTISYAFSWMKSFLFWSKFRWSLFLRVKHWSRYWLGAEYATSHYLEQCWPDSLTHTCGTRGRWVKTYRYSNYIKRLVDYHEHVPGTAEFVWTRPFNKILIIHSGWHKTYRYIFSENLPELHKSRNCLSYLLSQYRGEL